ncbi:ODA4 [Symbiodinium pilosum]|uniref:ODA4 protein n=1 Tax=Symbiodinium pilosum TaxID=2952 RepID=A0A812JUJ1_SYMPI|nr:ODA4 [Symbiodinium pilosum]
MKVVSDVSAIVDIMKGNLRKISGILSQWCRESMLERKRGAKPVSVEEFEQNHKARVGVRLMNMTDGGKEIHRYVKDSSESLKISKSAGTWKAYVDFVNNVVIEGFVSAIAVSLQYLCEILDPLIIARHEMLPLFDVKIELQGDEIAFDPPFEDEDAPSRTTLRSTIDGWLKDFFAMATVMVRLDSNMGDYLNEIKEHFQMQCLLSLVSELIDNTESKCLEYRENFMTHSFLWTDSVEKTFDRFLQEDPKELVEFEEGGMSFREIMHRIKVDLGPVIPSLERFEKEVARFEHLKQELSMKKTPTDIHWLRIDAQPVKVTLVNCARKWEEKYTGFLRTFVEDRISSLSTFIDSVRTGLGPPSAAENPEDERLLYQTMTKIRDVKLARGAMQRLFHPLREQVQMLKKHHANISEECWNNLEQAPAHWAEVDRAAFNEKEKILPLQNQEMQKIRVKIEGFREDVRNFRAEFLERCPFGSEHAITGSYDKSYAIINEYYGRTMEIQARAEQFNVPASLELLSARGARGVDFQDLELLFDMAMSDYRPLQGSDCLSNLVLLKNLWDLIVLVRETFSAWYSVPWEKIDTGQMLVTVRELAQQVRSAQKGLRAWPLYAWLQDEVKNMSAALPLVNELHSDTMRDRHWALLMAVTKKTFEKGPEFSFRHLLEVELHHFSSDVYDIVDQSVKEAKIEGKLDGIRKTWSKMSVDFDNTREDCPLLADLSEVLERLESDSLEMLSMASQVPVLQRPE